MDNNIHKVVSVLYDDTCEVVIARVCGKALHSDHVEARERSKRICSERKCFRLLVDLRELNTENSTTLDCFSFGRTMARELNGLRVAYVIPVHEKSLDDLRFTLKVGEDPSVVVAEFTSYDVALDWLRKGL